MKRASLTEIIQVVFSEILNVDVSIGSQSASSATAVDISFLATKVGLSTTTISCSESEEITSFHEACESRTLCARGVVHHTSDGARTCCCRASFGQFRCSCARRGAHDTCAGLVCSVTPALDVKDIAPVPDESPRSRNCRVYTSSAVYVYVAPDQDVEYISPALAMSLALFSHRLLSHQLRASTFLLCLTWSTLPQRRPWSVSHQRRLVVITAALAVYVAMLDGFLTLCWKVWSAFPPRVFTGGKTPKGTLLVELDGHKLQESSASRAPRGSRCSSVEEPEGGGMGCHGVARHQEKRFSWERWSRTDPPDVCARETRRHHMTQWRSVGHTGGGGGHPLASLVARLSLVPQGCACVVNAPSPEGHDSEINASFLSAHFSTHRPRAPASDSRGTRWRLLRGSQSRPKRRCRA